MREYWPVERNSVRCALTELLNGMAQKLVAATLPVLVVRKMFSKSTKPPGVNSAPPMRTESGDSFGFSWGSTESETVLAAGLTLVVVRVALTICPDWAFAAGAVWLCVL